MVYYFVEIYFNDFGWVRFDCGGFTQRFNKNQYLHSSLLPLHRPFPQLGRDLFYLPGHMSDSPMTTLHIMAGVQTKQQYHEEIKHNLFRIGTQCFINIPESPNFKLYIAENFNNNNEEILLVATNPGEQIGIFDLQALLALEYNSLYEITDETNHQQYLRFGRDFTHLQIKN